MSRAKEIARAFENQFGHLIAEGPQHAQFWVRVFQLQEQIDYVKQRIWERPERKKASVPAIGHYIVDENLTFIYCLHFTVDGMGVQDCVGKIWFAGDKFKAEAFRRRNELADQMMKVMEARQNSEAGEYIEGPFDIEIRNMPPGKESGVYDNPPDDKSR